MKQAKLTKSLRKHRDENRNLDVAVKRNRVIEGERGVGLRAKMSRKGKK